MDLSEMTVLTEIQNSETLDKNFESVEHMEAAENLESMLNDLLSGIHIEEADANPESLNVGLKDDIPSWLNDEIGEGVEENNELGKELPSWFEGENVGLEKKNEIPTPRESEIHAQEIYGGEEQKSFLGGHEVPLFTPGSTRPDLVVDNHLAIEVKNYNLNSEVSCNNLCQELRRQIGDRVENLPEGYEQKIVLDIRGRDYADGIVDSIIERIKDKCNDIYPDIPVDIMEV